MANHGPEYGLTAEVNRKICSKFDEKKAKEILDFVNHYVPDAYLTDVSWDGIKNSLKSGVILCKLINKIQPGSVKKINESQMAFKQMENIANFLDACSQYGVAKNDTFQTVDLYEGKNIPQVMAGLEALGRKAKSKNLFGIGAKESTRNERDFTEQQLKAGQHIIGLQMGTNKGANQSGQNFGKTRQIID